MSEVVRNRGKIWLKSLQIAHCTRELARRRGPAGSRTFDWRRVVVVDALL